MRKTFVLLSIFVLLLGKEYKLQLTLNAIEKNINYGYINTYFYNKYKPKGMDSLTVNFTSPGLKTLELTWENEITSLRGMFEGCTL